MEREAGHLYLGHLVESGEPGAPLTYDSGDLTTHGVIVGMTGSGKTGLAIVTLEEALLAGISVLALDLKGDLTNLKLVFPELRPDDFAPWIEADADGPAPAEAAAAIAERWRGGLERSGLGSDDLRALRDAAEVTVYTPGSTAGVPLNIIGDLAAPSDADAESLREEAASFASGILGLVGIEADPLSSREHILIANLLEDAWTAGQHLDLAGLITRILEPPLRKLGVFEIDAFFPADDRRDLAMRLNALLASPTYAAWIEGEALDVERLFRTADGRPRAAVMYLAHLSDAERQFVVTLVLSKLVTWMRRQAGTGDLRALVYLDEVFGFVPPTAEPPAKRVILTLMKQARAFGVGMLLATQNPVDLDYKAMSNAGTWVIGRLQTERDKARILEGLRAAAGGVDIDAVSDLIGGLGSREFVYHNTHEQGGPRLFTSRWAMSYLRGPLTREQIALLEPSRTVEVAPKGTRATPAATAPAPAAESLAADETLVAPETPRGVPVYYADPSAPWVREFGAVPGGTRFAPAIAARVHLRFDERKAKLDHQEEWEAVLFPLGARPQPAEARTVDHDPRDFRDAAPEGAVYRLGDAPLQEAAFYRDFRRDLVAHLHRDLDLDLWQNAALKLYSRPGETQDEFAARCDAAAQDAADAEAAKLRDRYETKMDRVRDAIARAEERVEQLETDTKSRRGHEIIAAASDLLGSFFGGKRTTRGIASSAGRILKGASSRRGMSSRTSQRLETAKERVEDETEELGELEEELADELIAIDDRWREAAQAIEAFAVPLEKNDIGVDEIALVWIPVE